MVSRKAVVISLTFVCKGVQSFPMPGIEDCLDQDCSTVGAIGTSLVSGFSPGGQPDVFFVGNEVFVTSKVIQGELELYQSSNLCTGQCEFGTCHAMFGQYECECPTSEHILTNDERCLVNECLDTETFPGADCNDCRDTEDSFVCNGCAVGFDIDSSHTTCVGKQYAIGPAHLPR